MSKLVWWQFGNCVSTKPLTHAGKSQSLRAWARECGIGTKAMWVRVHTWSDLGLALTAPPGTKGKAIRNNQGA